MLVIHCFFVWLAMLEPCCKLSANVFVKRKKKERKKSKLTTELENHLNNDS